MRKKVILSAGGTGGHLFPAQAVANELQKRSDILFVGKDLGKNRYFDQKKYPYKEISAATLTLKKPLKLMRESLLILKGVFQSLKIIEEFKPDCVIGFGSFFTLPLLTAALIKRVPIYLHEQNSVPGKVNRLFSRWAHLTAVTFPLTQTLLKGKTTLVTFPSRFEVKKIDLNECYNYFGLKKNKKTLLIFGGSQGGKGINALSLEMAAAFANRDVQILHFTGKAESVQETKEIYTKYGLTFCVKEFETRMDLAFSIATAALTRAGAATISELIAWNVPAILIPFPFATEDHQAKNGEFFVREVQGGEMFIEKNVTSAKLFDSLTKLLEGSFEEKKKNISNYRSKKNYPKLEEII